jgi:hypothetical protein
MSGLSESRKMLVMELEVYSGITLQRIFRMVAGIVDPGLMSLGRSGVVLDRFVYRLAAFSQP